MTLTTNVTASDELILTAAAGYQELDPTPADNTVTLRANTPITQPTSPPPPVACRGVRRVRTIGPNRLDGTACPDFLRGLGGTDSLFGLAGADRLLGGPGNDLLDAGADNDRLEGGEGNDRLLGRSGTDTLLGGSGADTLDPGAGPDLIAAGRGSDVVNARDGSRDTITCGPGIERVSADRTDRVSSDCEHVQRSQRR